MYLNVRDVLVAIGEVAYNFGDSTPSDPNIYQFTFMKPTAHEPPSVIFVAL